MTTHKEIFLKHGIQPPEEFYIPNNATVNAQATALESHWGKSNNVNYHELAAFQFAISSCADGLKITDHKLFISSFNFEYDPEKLHPDFFYSLKLFDSTYKIPNSSYFIWFTYEFDLDEDAIDKYSSHFSPSYRMQKLFSSNAKNTTYFFLAKYFQKHWEESLKQLKSSSLLTDLYEHILQEQDKK